MRCSRNSHVYLLCLQGGFTRWVKDGLPVEKKSDYEAGQIDVLADNLEVVAARVSDKKGQTHVSSFLYSHAVGPCQRCSAYQRRWMGCWHDQRPLTACLNTTPNDRDFCTP